MPLQHPWIYENAKRDLWFKERAKGGGWNCYFFPQGWAQDFSEENGFAQEGDEIYGYAPLHTYGDSEVYEMFVRAETLDKMTETTEEEARRLHPRLADHLDEINGVKK